MTCSQTQGQMYRIVARVLAILFPNQGNTYESVVPVCGEFSLFWVSGFTAVASDISMMLRRGCEYAVVLILGSSLFEDNFPALVKCRTWRNEQGLT
jgi:hypothetical protein